MNNPFRTTVIRIASAFALADEVVDFLHAGSIDRKIATCLCILFFGTPIAVQAAPVLGTPHNEAAVQASWGSVGIGGDSCGGGTVFGSSPIANGCEAGSASGPADANTAATVGMGAVHISTSARANTIGTATVGASAVGNATLQDYFAISGPPGSFAHLSSSIVISGGLSALVVGPSAAQSAYIVQTSVGSSSASGTGQYWVASNSPDVVSNITGGVLPLGVDIFFGPDGWAPVTLSIHAQLASEGTASASQECSTCALIGGAFSTGAQFGSTIFWGGISLLTVDGVPLTDYQVISASGADYRYATDGLAPAVPEPASVGLLLFGLAAMGGYARNFRKSGDMQVTNTLVPSRRRHA